MKDIAQSGQTQLAAAAAANLLTTDAFAVLGGAGITNTGPTTITGDVGTFPTVTETGFGSVTLSGTDHAGDATTQGAKTDLVTVYNDLAGQTSDATISADLGGQTLVAGVYTSASTIGLTGSLTLDAAGDPDAVFVFQAGSALTTASGSSINLINGAQSCNVFWQVGSDATLGTGSTFRGTLVALTSITVTTGVTVDGRVLARNGAVTLDTNTITKSTCSGGSLGTLRVVKSVVGAAAASSFSVNVKTVGGTNVSGSPAAGAALPGTSYSLAAGTYNVSEGAHAGYTQTFGADCPGGSVTLGAGDDKTCTVVNTEDAAPVATGVSSGGGSWPTTPPLINVTKVPTPLALPAGPGLVTYDYVVLNVGPVEMSTVKVTDDKCSTVAYVSGDSNKDTKLDAGETWKYQCATTLSTTTTNTVTATGVYNGRTATDTAEATVVVGAPVVPPLIHLLKKPSVFTLPSTGGAVTYSYAVTNPGTAPLSDVSVSDDKCTGLPGRVTGHPGDINKNDLLESNETWSFTCQTNLTQTTTNTGTALGHANGFTATDSSFATVVVASPKLPQTGIAPDDGATLWSALALASLFVLSFLFYFVRRGQVV